MTRVIPTAAAVCVLALAVACGDSPTKPSEEITRFGVQLSPASQVPPVLNTEASGSGTATISFKITRDAAGAIATATADFQVSLSFFPPTTAPILAHIHRGAAGANGLFVVDTGLGPGQVNMIAGFGSFNKVGIVVTPALMQEILSTPSGFYFDVHTVANLDGVARGQLVRQ